MKLSCFTAGLIGVLALLVGRPADGAAVSEPEAVSIAEWWYAAEVNAGTTALPVAEKQVRVAAMNKHEISYILGRDNWQPTRKAGDAVAAYVFAFQPSGFVVVSGEDTLQPVLAFNVIGSFRKNAGPRTNYLSYYLERCVAGAVEHARSPAVGGHLTHTNWVRLREWVKSGTTQTGGASGPSRPGPSGPSPAGGGGPSGPGPDGGGGVYVLLPTAVWNQGNYYNTVCAASNGGIFVWTGCTATAMAIQMRYYQWPWWGNSAHSYTNTLITSEAKYTFTQYANFASQYYNWPSMPTNDLTTANPDVANLMYDCGVAVNMNYGDINNGSGAWPSPSAMNNYFRYRGTSEIDSTNESDHTPAMSYCIQCGVPVIFSTPDHTPTACGYRNTVAPYFYLNLGWGGSENGWYDLDDIPPPASDPDIVRSYPYSTPNNYAYVDGVTSSGNGDLQTPYQTFASGLSGVSSNGVLWLKTGQYTGNQGRILSKPMTISSYLGEATIGN